MKNDKYKKNIRLAVLFIMMILSGLSNVVKSQSIKGINDIDTLINSAMKHWDVPGLAIGVIKDGKVIFSRGFGYKDLKTKEKVTTKTLFSIASCTKSFTATAAAMIVDEKKMSFDIPLKTYFPDFQMYDKAAGEKVSLRDLLTHRTGIQRQKFFSINPPNDRKGVRASMKYFEPNWDFRSLWQYCNETITVAGDMVAERAGTTWEDLIKKRILNPLGMKSTIFSYRELYNKPDYAKPYIVWDKEPEEMDYHDADILGPAGCIISNVEDLSKWVLFNLNKGKAGDAQIINPLRLQQIQSPQMVIPGVKSSPEISYQNYGMGWFIDYYRGKLHINHPGGLYGFSAMVSFMPEENIGIVILANLNGTPFIEILERYVMDYLLNLDPIDWQKKSIDLEEAHKKQMFNLEKSEVKTDLIKKPSMPLNKYIGIYESNGYGSLNVRNEKDSLMVKLLKYDCPLIYKGNETFELYHPVEHSGWKTIFMKNEQGNITELSVQVNPNVKPVLFKKKV